MTVEKIRDWEKFEGTLRDYASWLGSAVPGASDLDFVVERRGHFLVLEAKPWSNGINVGFGQYLMLETLAKIDAFDVYLVGEAPKSGACYLLRLDPANPPVKKATRPVWYPPRRFMRMTRDTLREFVKNWFEEASA